METLAFLEIAESDDNCKSKFCVLCVKQIAFISVIIYNSMYPIHQIIYIKVNQKPYFFSC